MREIVFLTVMNWAHFKCTFIELPQNFGCFSITDHHSKTRNIGPGWEAGGAQRISHTTSTPLAPTQPRQSQRYHENNCCAGPKFFIHLLQDALQESEIHQAGLRTAWYTTRLIMLPVSKYDDSTPLVPHPSASQCSTCWEDKWDSRKEKKKVGNEDQGKWGKKLRTESQPKGNYEKVHQTTGGIYVQY